MGWSGETAAVLVKNLQNYHSCKSPFIGGNTDAQMWWESLTLPATEYPIKSLALTLFAVVPHAADVRHLFSGLGGIQSVKRSWLSVQNFEMLGMLRNHYIFMLQKGLATKGHNI
jgi:hypothetical protein